MSVSPLTFFPHVHPCADLEGGGVIGSGPSLENSNKVNIVKLPTKMPRTPWQTKMSLSPPPPLGKFCGCLVTVVR